MDYARRTARRYGSPLVGIAAVSTVTPTFPNTVIEMPNFATDSAAALARARATVQAGSIAPAAYEQAGIGPEDVDVAEVYDLSTALELDWYEDIGLCGPGEAEKLLRDGDDDARRPHPGEPVGRPGLLRRGRPGPGASRRCASSTWQLRGQAGGRQVEGADVGITANQGLFGHGSSVIVSR